MVPRARGRAGPDGRKDVLKRRTGWNYGSRPELALERFDRRFVVSAV